MTTMCLTLPSLSERLGGASSPSAGAATATASASATANVSVRYMSAPFVASRLIETLAATGPAESPTKVGKRPHPPRRREYAQGVGCAPVRTSRLDARGAP